MPIDIDEFESGSAEDLRGEERSDREAVLEFLGLNRDAAFSRHEIADATGISGVKLFMLLVELEDRGLVRHKGEYWAIDEAYEPSDGLTLDPFGESPDGDSPPVFDDFE